MILTLICRDDNLSREPSNQSLLQIGLLKNSMQIGLLHSAHNKPITAAMNNVSLLALERTLLIFLGFDVFYLDFSLHHVLTMSTISGNKGTKTNLGIKGQEKKKRPLRKGPWKQGP